MMGQQPRTESLFYYFRLEEQIPADHLLRMINCYVDFSFVREQLKGFYSATGRPSIDPEVLLRLLVVGYLYGITSERRLMEEVRHYLSISETRSGFCDELRFERHQNAEAKSLYKTHFSHAPDFSTDSDVSGPMIV